MGKDGAWTKKINKPHFLNPLKDFAPEVTQDVVGSSHP